MTKDEVVLPEGPENGHSKALAEPKASMLDEVDFLRWQLMHERAKSASTTFEYYNHMAVEAQEKLEVEKLEARKLLEVFSDKYKMDFRLLQVGSKGELTARHPVPNLSR